MTASLLSPCRQITAQVKEKVGEQDKKKRRERGGSLIELVKLGVLTFLENAGAVLFSFEFL